MAQHYLVAVDGSEMSRRALKRAVQLMKPGEGDKLTLIHVVEPVSPYVYGAYEPQLVEETMRLGEKLLNREKEWCETELQMPCEAVLLQGHPPFKIIRYAKEHDVDLIVMGSRGLSGIKEVFLGSVSHGVMQSSPIPVLIEK